MLSEEELGDATQVRFRREFLGKEYRNNQPSLVRCRRAPSNGANERGTCPCVFYYLHSKRTLVLLRNGPPEESEKIVGCSPRRRMGG